MSLRILLEVELASLPWHRGKDGSASGGHAWVRIADDELHAMQAALHQRGEEAAPVYLRLAQSGAQAQHGALAVGADARARSTAQSPSTPAWRTFS